MDAKEFREKIGHGSMREKLDNWGITDEYLKNKLKQELNAHESKSFLYKGQVIESEKKIAWSIRQNARQDAHKLRGDYPAEKHQVESDLAIEIVNYGEDDKKSNP